MISGDDLVFFNEKPAALPLYEAFAQRLFAEIDDVTVRVQKTQIVDWMNKHRDTLEEDLGYAKKP